MVVKVAFVVRPYLALVGVAVSAHHESSFLTVVLGGVLAQRPY